MTSAEHIRGVAERLGYWSTDTAGKRRLRALIKHQYPYTRQAIELALKRGSKPGKPKHPRCPHCNRPMPKETTT